MGQRLIEIGNILKGYYPAAENGLGDDCFVNANGVVFKVCSWPDGKYVFMDYADNIEDARNGLFEEGDGFLTMQPIEELIKILRKEIDSQF